MKPRFGRNRIAGIVDVMKSYQGVDIFFSAETVLSKYRNCKLMIYSNIAIGFLIGISQGKQKITGIRQ